MSATPPRGIVARITEAGGIASVGGYGPEQKLYREAIMPYGTDAKLVAEIEAEGWRVIIAPTRRVLR